MVVFEVHLGEIPEQVRLADMVELTVHGTFEQSEERFDGIGMVETASANIFIDTVVDRAVAANSRPSRS